jgi:TetR/AcrR family transcriptional regulator
MGSTSVFKRLPEEKQHRILDAAVTQFAQNGYEQTSMNRVVLEAGISKGSLFQYFSSKFDLFDTVVSYATKLVRSKLRNQRDATKNLAFSIRLSKILETGFQFIREHPLLSRIYFQMLHSGKAPFGEGQLSGLHSESVGFLSRIIQEGIVRGDLRGDLDVNKTAFLLNGVMLQLLHAYYTEHVDSGYGLYRGGAKDVQDWIDATVDVFVNGLGSSTSSTEISS